MDWAEPEVLGKMLPGWSFDPNDEFYLEPSEASALSYSDPGVSPGTSYKKVVES
jgi:hypothetical protein